MRLSSIKRVWNVGVHAILFLADFTLQVDYPLITYGIWTGSDPGKRFDLPVVSQLYRMTRAMFPVVFPGLMMKFWLSISCNLLLMLMIILVREQPGRYRPTGRRDR